MRCDDKGTLSPSTHLNTTSTILGIVSFNKRSAQSPTMSKSDVERISHHDNVEALNDSALHHAAEKGQAATDK